MYSSVARSSTMLLVWSAFRFLLQMERQIQSHDICKAAHHHMILHHVSYMLVTWCGFALPGGVHGWGRGGGVWEHVQGFIVLIGVNQLNQLPAHLQQQTIQSWLDFNLLSLTDIHHTSYIIHADCPTRQTMHMWVGRGRSCWSELWKLLIIWEKVCFYWDSV